MPKTSYLDRADDDGLDLCRRAAILGFIVLATAPSLSTAEEAQGVGERGNSREVGAPLLTSYSFRDYTAHPQNWAIVQDHRGVMYFGNTEGVLEHDGISWRLIPVTNNSIVRSLAVDRHGTVYVGAVGELGYLEADDLGQLGYRSLLDEIPAPERELADVWRTFATDDGVFFWSYARLFRWHEDRFQSWMIDSHWVPATIGGKLYYNTEDRGLQVFSGQGFETVEGTEELAGVRVNVILDAGDGALLLGTREGRMLILRAPVPGASPAARLEPFVTEAGDYLADHRLYNGARLPDGAYLLATMDGGAAIVGPGGELRRVLDRDSGLPDNSVWAAFVDPSGGLWLGLNRGLAHVEITSPISYFSESSGIDGTVEAFTRHDGVLHAATGVGLYRFDRDHFVRIAGLPGPCWSLLSFTPPSGGRPRLLVGASPGVYEVEGDRARRVHRANNAYVIYPSPSQPETVWIGESGGFSRLRFEAGEWIDGDRLVELQDSVRSIAEDADGDLWLGTHFSGVLRARAGHDPRRSPIEVVSYTTEHGLPDLKSVKILALDGELLFGTSQGIWRFDAATDRFTLGPSFAPDQVPGDLGILRMAPDSQGDLWLTRTGTLSPVLASRQADGSFKLEDRPFRRLPPASWYAVYPDRDEIVWFGGTEGLYRFDASNPSGVDVDFETLIRSVSKPDGTLLYHGAPDSPFAALTATEPLEYSDNSLAFLFTATCYNEADKTRFRHRLDGYDDDWSPWTSHSKKEYTNLREGAYTFRVQASNLYGTLGSEATYSFRILAPWYRTLGFRTVVALATVALLWSLSRALVSRAKRLQKEASEREQAREREHLIRRLEEQNAELERFTYTVSHDLKSPLVTIRGFLGFLRRDAAAGDMERLERDLGRIESAASKMSELLEDLLELSRIGRQINPPQRVAMEEVTAEALELLSGPVTERGVEVDVAPDLPPVYGDRARILELFQNLLENAVKYMGDQPSPRIEIGVAQRSDDENVFYVRDNGIGVEPSYHDKIFGLFERLDANTEGTGIGLALAKRIVELHGGRIWIESEGQGRGSTFFAAFPTAENASS